MADSHEDSRLEQLDQAFREASDRRRHGALDEAETAFRALLEAYGEAGADERRVMVGINLAQVLQQRGQLDDAAAVYDEALRRGREIGDERRVGLCLGGLAMLAQEKGDLGRAEGILEEALAIFRKRGDAVGIGNQLGNLGLLRQQQDRLGEAIACFTEAAHCFVQAGYAPGAIGVLQCVGEVHRRQGEFDEAEAAHRQALMLAEQTGNAIAQAHSMRALGQVRRLRGDLEGAQKHILDGLAIHRRMNDQRGYLSALIDLGTVEFALGQGTGAIRHLGECIEAARAGGLVTPLTKALLNRALYRLDTAHLDEVEADLAEAGELLEHVPDALGSCVQAVTSARVMIRRGDWKRAEEVLLAQLERAQRANLAAVRAPVLGLLASIESLRGSTRGAVARFEEAEAHYRSIGDVDGARMAVLARVRLLAETGKLEQAQMALDALLEAMRTASLQQPVLEAEAVSARAGLLDLREDFAGARAEAEAARRLYVQAGFELAEIGAGLVYYQAETNAHRLAGAAVAAEPSADLFELVERSRRFDSPSTLAVAQCTLADALVVRGRGAEARGMVREALETSRAISFPDGIARALQVLARIESRRALAIEAWRQWHALEGVVRADRLRREWNLTEAECRGDDVTGG